MPIKVLSSTAVLKRRTEGSRLLSAVRARLRVDAEVAPAAVEDTKEGKEDVDVDTAQEDGVIGDDDYMDVDEARDLNLQPQRSLEEMLTGDPSDLAHVGDSGWDQ